MSEQTISSEEKRIKRIAQLEARLQKEKAKQKDILRKERNGQLMAFGIYLEAYLKSGGDEVINKFMSSMKELLSGRNLERCLSGLKRISSEINSPEK